MKAKVISTSNYKELMSKEELVTLAGHLSAICRTDKEWEDILKESPEVTAKRVEMINDMRHHAGYDPIWITVYFDDIPKIMAMLLNNMGFYSTLEKSSRHKKLKVTEREQKLYDKWSEIIKKEAERDYPCRANRAESLGKENARYMTSIETLTSMAFATSFRNLNYAYGWAWKLLEKKELNELEEIIVRHLPDFIKALEGTGYIYEPLINDFKDKSFTLVTDINEHEMIEEHFGDTYETVYKGSTAMLAQNHRHRTLENSIAPLREREYYILTIFSLINEASNLVDCNGRPLNSQAITEDWLADIRNTGHPYPQGRLVSISENGNIRRFIEKLKERLCSEAQLEVNDSTKRLLLKYIKELKEKNTTRSLFNAAKLEKYNNGARCTFPDYECPKPCGFKEGISLVRKI